MQGWYMGLREKESPLGFFLCYLRQSSFKGKHASKVYAFIPAVFRKGEILHGAINAQINQPPLKILDFPIQALLFSGRQDLSR